MRYSFVTVWTIPAPLKPVWETIFAVDRWPTWWRGLEPVILLKPRTCPDGTGAVHRLTFQGPLPYRLTFDSQVTKVNLFERIESQATGELEGTGVWTFSFKGTSTVVRYDWNVRTAKFWMNLAAPLLWPTFRWNHDAVMDQGEKGIVRLLTGRGSPDSATRNQASSAQVF